MKGYMLTITALC